MMFWFKEIVAIILTSDVICIQIEISLKKRVIMSEHTPWINEGITFCEEVSHQVLAAQKEHIW